LRLRRRKLGFGLGDVQLAHESSAKSRFRKFQCFRLRLNVLLRDRQPPLEAAHIGVVPRHFRNQRHQHIAAILIGDLNVRIRGFHRAAHVAEEI
jgi:hypothetical protein